MNWCSISSINSMDPVGMGLEYLPTERRETKKRTWPTKRSLDVDKSEPNRKHSTKWWLIFTWNSKQPVWNGCWLTYPTFGKRHHVQNSLFTGKVSSQEFHIGLYNLHRSIVIKPYRTFCKSHSTKTTHFSGPYIFLRWNPTPTLLPIFRGLYYIAPTRWAPISYRWRYVEPL